MRCRESSSFFTGACALFTCEALAQRAAVDIVGVAVIISIGIDVARVEGVPLGVGGATVYAELAVGGISGNVYIDGELSVVAGGDGGYGFGLDIIEIIVFEQAWETPAGNSTPWFKADCIARLQVGKGDAGALVNEAVERYGRLV